MTYEQYKKELLRLMKLKDREGAHELLDDILCCIAMDAAFGKLTPYQTNHLIELYKENPKWYA